MTRKYTQENISSGLSRVRHSLPSRKVVINMKLIPDEGVKRARRKAALILGIIAFVLIAFVSYKIWDFIVLTKTRTVVSQDKNFKVYMWRFEDDWFDPRWEYVIYDASGKVVREPDYIDSSYNITQTDEIVTIRVGSESSYSVEYYDIVSNRFSPVFMTPIWLGNDIAVTKDFMYSEVVVVAQDKFDPNVFYREYKFDVSPVEYASEAFISLECVNEHQVALTYLSGENFTETTTVIDIRE